MALTITPGRTWVIGETITAPKLNQSFTGATVDYNAFQDVGSPYNAVAGDFIWIAAGDTINLPGSPSDNDQITFAQLSGDMTSSNATISGGAKSFHYNGIATSDTSITIDRNFCYSFSVIYNSATGYWKVI